ncbi:MAG: ABC transporter ATP-binding protein [Oscillospiraceae bacterium]|nr:ABC transporter ATP-binding protein [Oscillospiraceae bacterium]
MQEELLKAEGVTKRFGGLTALNDVSLHIKKGEIVGLIGPNGAGKTTLFNSINGSFGVTSGRIIFEGNDITHLSPDKRCHLGIGRTFQITKPFSGMTVLENVAVGALFGRKANINMMSGALMEESMAKAEDILKFMGFSSKKDARAGTLNVPERKRLEICRALASEPKLLLLDEVIAGLNPSEVGEMVELIHIVNQSGITILMIEHVMKAVMRLSHRMYVLSFGKLIAQGSPQEITSNSVVIEAYLGKLGQREAKHAES